MAFVEAYEKEESVIPNRGDAFFFFGATSAVDLVTLLVLLWFTILF